MDIAKLANPTHTFDVMHIEKNVCESVVHFIFGQNNTIEVW
jgi:hypothetical protein